MNYSIKRDLEEKQVEPVEILWNLPEVTELLRKQREEGSWKYPGRTPNLAIGQNYSLLETYRNLRVLVEMYGLTRGHSALQKAAGYVFNCQTAEGDIRGIIGNQNMPYYHGSILELLIKAGYSEDPHVTRGLDWLFSMRQEDVSWVVPAQIIPPRMRSPEFWKGPPVHPDRTKPHAHLASGMALRALASHPEYRQRPEVFTSGKALKSRLFKPHKYNDRKAKSYWFKFQFPYWWSNLLTALDTLFDLGFEREDEEISVGMNWFISHQEGDGLWSTGYRSGRKAEANRIWVGFAIGRILKKFYSKGEDEKST